MHSVSLHGNSPFLSLEQRDKPAELVQIDPNENAYAPQSSGTPARFFSYRIVKD